MNRAASRGGLMDWRSTSKPSRRHRMMNTRSVRCGFGPTWRSKFDPARDPAKVLGSLNIHQTLNALVWDPTNGTVAESCTAMVTNENNEKTEGLSKLLTWAALLQNSAAHSRSRRVADSVGRHCGGVGFTRAAAGGQKWMSSSTCQSR